MAERESKLFPGLMQKIVKHNDEFGNAFKIAFDFELMNPVYILQNQYQWQGDIDKAQKSFFSFFILFCDYCASLRKFSELNLNSIGIIATSVYNAVPIFNALENQQANSEELEKLANFLTDADIKTFDNHIYVVKDDLMENISNKSEVFRDAIGRDKFPKNSIFVNSKDGDYKQIVEEVGKNEGFIKTLKKYKLYELLKPVEISVKDWITTTE